MNITALRPRFLKHIEPIATVFCRAGVSPNQISLISLLFGLLCAVCYVCRMFAIGSIFLFFSAILDLVDGSVARRTEKETQFGSVFDWIVDKYVDALVILAIGLSGTAILSRFGGLTVSADYAVVAIAIIGSLMNTFIKPVVYAETGYQERVDGKIEDPLEGVGLFGRPETILVLVVGGLTGFIWVAVVLIAIGTNVSAIQRIIYLYKRLS